MTSASAGAHDSAVLLSSRGFCWGAEIMDQDDVEVREQLEQLEREIEVSGLERDEYLARQIGLLRRSQQKIQARLDEIEQALKRHHFL